jgi:hypothetical protein
MYRIISHGSVRGRSVGIKTHNGDLPFLRQQQKAEPDFPVENDNDTMVGVGVGLDKMNDKLDKLMVRPLSKPKNIKFKVK